MQELFKQYGPAIFSAFVTAALFALIFMSWNDNQGYLSYVGEDVGFILADSDDGNVDTANVEGVLNRDKPQVKINGHLKEKKGYFLIDNFTITDADGFVWNRAVTTDGVSGWFVKPNGAAGYNSGKVAILSIRDSAGNYYYDSMNHINMYYDYTNHKPAEAAGSTKGIFDASTGWIVFPLADNYTIKIRVMDCENVTTTVECRISVDYVMPGT